MKARKLTKVLLIALSLIMMLTSLAACDLFGGKEEETTTQAPEETTTKAPDANGDPNTPAEPETTLWETDEEGYAVTTIPKDTNWNGREVKTLIYKDSYLFPEKTVMDQEGDIIQKDIYTRDREIEYELGMKLDVKIKASHMSSGDDGADLYNAVLDGQDKYDVVCCYSLYPAKMALEGVLYDINGLEYPHTEMPWFAEDIQEWAIYDHLFFVANNSSIRNLLSVWSIYTNKDAIAAKGLEEIEDVVLDGRWTLAKMQEYSRNWASEAQSAPGTIYGIYVHHRTGADAFYTAAGFRAMTRDADNNPAYAFMDATNSELIYDFVDELIVMLNSPECVVGPYSGTQVDLYGRLPITYLRNSEAVFYVASMEFYKNMPEDTNYCIIPMPKYTESQEKYYSIRNDAFNMWCVPSTTDNPEIGGMVIEAVSYSDYRKIAPKFWDNDFIYRYSDDDNGVQIFEIIRDSVRTDFGRVYRAAGMGDNNEAIGSPYDAMRNSFRKNSNELGPDWSNQWQATLDKKGQSYTNQLITLKTLIKTTFG